MQFLFPHQRLNIFKHGEKKRDKKEIECGWWQTYFMTELHKSVDMFFPE
jgi:hypothetical protein